MVDPSISRSYWEKRKLKLQKCLHVLDVTEQICNDPKRNKKNCRNMFMSDTTLVAWRLVIYSSIGLIDELFEKGFNVVLTGRFNQDTIEVYCSSIDDHPTAHSRLHTFCILSLYNPTKVVIQNANIDGKHAGEILVAYKQCLVYKIRECEKEAKEINKNLKDSLQKELLTRYTNEIPA
jgi:hypothetical protein